MDKTPNKYYLDVSYITNGEMVNGNKTTTNGIILQTTYDDAFNKKPIEHFWNQPYQYRSNSDDSVNKCFILGTNKFGYFKNHFFKFVALFGLFLLSGVVHYYIMNPSQGISSSYNYPVMNPDLCDPVNPYSDRSWFTPMAAVNFICDVPIEISEIFIEEVKFFNGITYVNCENCLSKLGCMSFIGFHYLGNDTNSKYNFFVDCQSNVYQSREWMCPYKSGQLWVGIVPDTLYTKRNSEEIERILKHFKSEIVSYAVKCRFFSVNGINYHL